MGCGAALAHFPQHLEVCRAPPVWQSREGRKTMKNNSKKIRGILAGAVLVAASAGLSAAQEVTSSRKVLKAVAAQYPAVLKRRGIGGTVKLRVLVNPSGTVKDVQVLGGNPILSDCAVKAVKQWVFVGSEKEESIEISVGFDPNSTAE
jgi:TonB family protein